MTLPTRTQTSSVYHAAVQCSVACQRRTRNATTAYCNGVDTSGRAFIAGITRPRQLKPIRRFRESRVVVGIVFASPMLLLLTLRFCFFLPLVQMRKSAVELLRHPWLKNPTNHLRKVRTTGLSYVCPGVWCMCEHFHGTAVHKLRYPVLFPLSCCGLVRGFLCHTKTTSTAVRLGWLLCCLPAPAKRYYSISGVR